MVVATLPNTKSSASRKACITQRVVGGEPSEFVPNAKRWECRSELIADKAFCDNKRELHTHLEASDHPV